MWFFLGHFLSIVPDLTIVETLPGHVLCRPVTLRVSMSNRKSSILSLGKLTRQSLGLKPGEPHSKLFFEVKGDTSGHPSYGVCVDSSSYDVNRRCLP